MIKSKTWSYLFFALAIFSLQSCISRLRRPEITGVVVDYDKNPIANCKVGEALTDKTGKFKLEEQLFASTSVLSKGRTDRQIPQMLQEVIRF